jgi:cobalt-precorrin-5B (C1)-methyltransferase
MPRLRTGLTTGLTAAAAAKAATMALLSGSAVGEVEVPSATGEPQRLAVASTEAVDGAVRCGIVKDAGDDPDVTHGMTVYASVSRKHGPGVSVDGGEGIGRVTKPGLKVAVGLAAINPVPMAMIVSAVTDAAAAYGGHSSDAASREPGFEVVISMPGGEEVAKRTMNARLGVIGGLSILGTTGIVEPMSDQALVDTIKAEIDVQMASGLGRLLMMPGNYGRDFARDRLGLDVARAIRFSNFIGEAIDHLVEAGAQAVTLIGHAGKLVKVAGGIMNTHSKHGDCRMEIIAAHAALAGADRHLIAGLLDSATTEAAIELLLAAGLCQDTWLTIGERIVYHLQQRSRGAIDIEFTVFTQEHGVLAKGLVKRADAPYGTDHAADDRRPR